MAHLAIDGVQRFPSTGITVIVVGGGVAGLMCALECWRKGNDVVVLERTAKLSSIGDYFTIPPSGMCTLKYYPSMYADYHKNVYNVATSIWSPDGSCKMKMYPEWVQVGAENTAAPDVKISFLKRRPVYTQMLLDQCLRLGISVHFSKTATHVEEWDDGVTIRTTDGENYTGDICIAADGIGSSFATDLMGKEPVVLDSGYAIARAAFPRELIRPGSAAEDLLKNVEEEPEFRVYVGEDLHVILFLTKDWVAVAYTHENDGYAAESWSNLRETDVFIKQLEAKAQKWHPAVIDFFKQIPDKVVDWRLKFRDPVEQWTSSSGRVLKLGDAAHPYLPTAGNGAVQAMEDAICIGECLRLAGKEDAAWATKVHNKLRFQRTSILQQAGFVNREELHHADLELLERQPEHQPGFFTMGAWLWAHNPETYATEKYAECFKHLKEGKQGFINTNLPPGHVYQPWTMESENKRMAAGIPSNLKLNGYWGI